MSNFFGSKPTRVELLNKAAPNFFHMIQHLLWEETLLHIARLTDKPTSTRGKANLTILSLPAVVACPATKTALNEMAEAAVRKTAFCRDWRNRRIAHHDLSLLMNPTAEPLAKGSIKQVNEALSSIVSVLNEVQMHYEGSESFFSGIKPLRGAFSLLHVLDAGIKKQAEWEEKSRQRDWLTQDRPRDL